MIWWVHRPNGSGTLISWAGQYPQLGYADEQLDDAVSTELQAFLAQARVTTKTISIDALAALLVSKGVLLPTDLTAIQKLPI